MKDSWKIENITIITGDDILENETITVEKGKIKALGKNGDTHFSFTIKNVYVYPGFINAHDHLLGTYWPKVGRKDGKPYENWLYWDNDLKSSEVYLERQQIETKDLYFLGAYKSIISGITTVQDHIPHFVNEPYIPIVPVRIIKNYSLAHAVSSFSLKWGDDIPTEYKRAVEHNQPFITHIEEGFDEETKECLPKLDQLGALGEHTVMIHGIAFSKEDIDLIAEKKGNVVWCPDSNMFMFHTTTNVPYLLKKGVNVCLGTDSTMSGGLNLLSEIKFAKATYKKLFEKNIDDKTLFKMITVNPAKALFIDKELGSIEKGKIADMVVVKKLHRNPYTNLQKAELEDIVLVVKDGKPIYGLPEFEDFFKFAKVKFQTIQLKGQDRIVIGDLLGVLKNIRHAIGYEKEFPFLPVAYP